MPFLALHFIGASVVRAFGGIISALTPERIVRDGLLLVIIATVFWGNLYRLDATLAMGATLLSSIVMLGLVSIFLRRLRPPSLDGAKPAYAAEEWWRPTLPLSVIMIADNLMIRPGVIHGTRPDGQHAGRRHSSRRRIQHSDRGRRFHGGRRHGLSPAQFLRPYSPEEDQAGLQSLSSEGSLPFPFSSRRAPLSRCCFSRTLGWCAFRPLMAKRGPRYQSPLLVLGQMLAAACRPAAAPHHDD